MPSRRSALTEKTPKSAKGLPGIDTTLYPAPFDKAVAGRFKRKIGDMFGLSNFGVNLTTLAPGACSALHHKHVTQDEFIYIVSGDVILHLGDETHAMTAGDVMGFPKGGPAHHLENTSNSDATYLEIGDRSPGDIVTYPNDDIKAALVDGAWVFTKKDGSAF